MRTCARRVGLLAVLVLSGAAQAQVYLRGQGDALPGSVEQVTDGGVIVSRVEGGVTQHVIVGLELVREVRGVQAGAFDERRAIAEKCWRGVTRVQRGDFAGAEPLLEELSPEFAGTQGPTGGAVFDALLRCRLARGAVSGSIAAWLRMLEARGGVPTEKAATWIGGRVEGGGVADEMTGLVPSLPPVFAPGAQGEASTGGLDELMGSGDAKVARLAMYYRAAAIAENGAGAEGGPVLVPYIDDGDEGVKLVRDVVLARAGDEAQRRAARERLEQRLRTDNPAGWVEAWCRVGIGRSLVKESDGAERKWGVLQMLHVPARLSRQSPELAAVALSESARVLDELGDTRGAWMLADELARSMPGSAALSHTWIRAIRARPMPAALAPGQGAALEARP